MIIYIVIKDLFDWINFKWEGRYHITTGTREVFLVLRMGEDRVGGREVGGRCQSIITHSYNLITMELKHYNVTQVHNGSWTVILLAIDPRNNVALDCISFQQLLRINLLDLRQYLIEVHSIIKVAVQITVMHRDSLSSMVPSIKTSHHC